MRRALASNEPTIAELETALSCCAEIIERCGDRFLPAFEVLEEALRKAEAKQDALSRVRARLRESRAA